MGADFFISICEDVCEHKRAQEIIEYRLGNLPEDILEEIAEYHCDVDDAIREKEEGLKEGDLFNLDDLVPIITRDLATKRIRQALDEVVYSPHRRDTAGIFIKGTYFIVSGGMSWGDSPTDALSEIEIIETSGVTEGLGSPDFDYDNFDFKA